MSEYRPFAFPCVGFGKDNDSYVVAISFESSFFSICPETARFIATDLLLWADRVEKMNDAEKHHGIGGDDE